MTVTDKCGRVIVFDDSWRTVKGDPRMSEILEAATSSTPYKEAVQAKLDGLTAEEVKKLPHHHGAKEFYKWWNSMEVLEEAILVMDGHRILVPLTARKNILQLLHIPLVDRLNLFTFGFLSDPGLLVRSMCLVCLKLRHLFET